MVGSGKAVAATALRDLLKRVSPPVFGSLLVFVRDWLTPAPVEKSRRQGKSRGAGAVENGEIDPALRARALQRAVLERTAAQVRTLCVYACMSRCMNV